MLTYGVFYFKDELFKSNGFLNVFFEIIFIFGIEVFFFFP